MQPLDPATHSDLREAITQPPGTLTLREEPVLRMSFSIGTKSDHMLQEIGNNLWVTRERIYQIDATALRGLKHPSLARVLSTFLDR